MNRWTVYVNNETAERGFLVDWARTVSYWNYDAARMQAVDYLKEYDMVKIIDDKNRIVFFEWRPSGGRT